MFRSLLAAFQGRSSRPSPRPVCPARRSTLGVEVLEGREVPALITVNSTADAISANSVLTLREAISLNTGDLSFNALSAAEKAQISGTIGSNDRIQFSVNGVINLGSDLPTLNKKLNIEGNGGVTINGATLYRPITVNAAGDVTVSGLKVFAGHTIDSGGAALNNGKLTFSRVEFDGNTSVKHGAAIENNGTLLVDECYFHNNIASKVGGGIDNNATATITDTSFVDNTAGNNGGAIWSSGTLTLSNDTFHGNHAVNFGGALRVTGGTTTITSCTITGNDADSDGSNSDFGGGISNGGSTVTMNNSVVAQNLRMNQIFKDDIDGIVNGQNNVISVDNKLTGITNGVNGNQVGNNATPIDPMLLALAFEGAFGPTRTPQQGSPLVGNGAPTNVSGQTDQRGAGRSGAVTIGAVQIASPLSPVGPSSQLYGPGALSTADEAFVKGLYRACLLRDADAAGLAGWLNVLGGHPENRDDVAHGFYNSYENRSNQVKFYYRYFLGREADAPGLASWVNQLQAGVDEAIVVRGFALSPEFTGKNNNTQFVNTMYYALLGRNADPAGFANWKSQLDNGTLSRGQMIDLFIRSTETIQRVVVSFYQSYLNTTPSPEALSFLTNAITSGFTFGTIAENVLSSQAFYDAGAAKVGI